MSIVTHYTVVPDPGKDGYILLMVSRERETGSMNVYQMPVRRKELIASKRTGTNHATWLLVALECVNKRLKASASEKLPPPFIVECTLISDREGELVSVENSKLCLDKLESALEITMDTSWENVFHAYEASSDNRSLPLRCLFFAKYIEYVKGNMKESTKSFFIKSLTDRSWDRNAMICMKEKLNVGELRLHDIKLTGGNVIRSLGEISQLISLKIGRCGKSITVRILNANHSLKFSDILHFYLTCSSFNLQSNIFEKDYVNSDGHANHSGLLPIHSDQMDMRIVSLLYGISPSENISLSLQHRALFLQAGNIPSNVATQTDNKRRAWRLAVFKVNCTNDEDEVFVCEVSSSKRPIFFPKTFIKKQQSSDDIMESNFIQEFFNNINKGSNIIETNIPITSMGRDGLVVVYCDEDKRDWLKESRIRCDVFAATYDYYKKVSNWSGGLIKTPNGDRYISMPPPGAEGELEGEEVAEIIDYDMVEFYPSIIKAMSSGTDNNQLLQFLSEWRNRLNGKAASFMKTMLVSFFGSLKHTDYLAYLSVIDVSNRCMSRCMNFFEEENGCEILLVMKDGILLRKRMSEEESRQLAVSATEATRRHLEETLSIDYGGSCDFSKITMEVRGRYNRLLLINTHTYMLIYNVGDVRRMKWKGIENVNHSGLTKVLLDCVRHYVLDGPLNIKRYSEMIESLKICIDSADPDKKSHGYSRNRLSPWLQLSFVLDLIHKGEDANSLTYTHCVCRPPASYRSSRIIPASRQYGTKRTANDQIMPKDDLFENIRKQYIYYDWSPFINTNNEICYRLRKLLSGCNQTTKEFITRKVDNDCRLGLVPVLPNTRRYDGDSLVATTCSHLEKLLSKFEWSIREYVISNHRQKTYSSLDIPSRMGLCL